MPSCHRKWEAEAMVPIGTIDRRYHGRYHNLLQTTVDIIKTKEQLLTAILFFLICLTHVSFSFIKEGSNFQYYRY